MTPRHIQDSLEYFEALIVIFSVLEVLRRTGFVLFSLLVRTHGNSAVQAQCAQLSTSARARSGLVVHCYMSSGGES